MATKKKKQAKPDYLKITALSLLGVFLVVNLYLWWNPSDPFNMISTSATSLAAALVFPIIGFVGIVFWILMLVDSWRKNKLIWFIFILLGPGIIGLLYFLVEKPKIIRVNAKRLAWVAIVLFTVSWVLFVIPDLKNRISPPPDTAPFVTLQGKILSKDVPRGPGVYQINNRGSGRTTQVDVGPPQSCDNQAVNIPDLKVGDSILVYAKQYGASDDSVSICATGTYIHKL